MNRSADDDVIRHGLSLTPFHYSYQVWWRSDKKWLSYCAKYTIFIRYQWTVKPVMTSSNIVRHWPHSIIHTKFDEDQMRNGWIIVQNETFSSVISEPLSRWWRHHGVIENDSSLTPFHYSYQVWWRSDEKWLSYCAKRTIFVRNQWTVTPMMTSSWRH